MNEFAIADVKHGVTNALVKNIMRQTGADDPNEAIRLVNSGEWVVVKQPLLELVASIGLPGTDKFVFDDEKRFKEELNIGYLDPDFTSTFLGKEEVGLVSKNFNAYLLKRQASDNLIRTQLKDEKQVEETTLFHLRQCIKRQSKGEKGFLLVNGYTNIFYICDAKGKLWAVSANFRSGGGFWYLYVRSVEGPDGWDADDRVVSSDC